MSKPNIHGYVEQANISVLKMLERYDRALINSLAFIFFLKFLFVNFIIVASTFSCSAPITLKTVKVNPMITSKSIYDENLSFGGCFVHENLLVSAL